MAGRVTRGAVAANTNVDSDSDAAPARAYDSDVYGDSSVGAMPGSTGYGSRGYQDEGYGTRYREDVGASSYADSGSLAPDSATGSSYPDVTPVGEEHHYSPPVGGDVRR